MNRLRRPGLRLERDKKRILLSEPILMSQARRRVSVPIDEPAPTNWLVIVGAQQSELTDELGVGNRLDDHDGVPSIICGSTRSPVTCCKAFLKSKLFQARIRPEERAATKC